MQLTKELKEEIKREILRDAEITTLLSAIELMHLTAIEAIDDKKIPQETNMMLAESVHDMNRLLNALK